MNSQMQASMDAHFTLARQCGGKPWSSDSTTYSLRGQEYRYICSLMALPFLPAADIQPAFQQLEQRATSPQLHQLVRYVSESWLKNPTWQPTNWNVYNLTIRTKNDVEGWHTRLNSYAGNAKLSFYKLVPLLQRESDIVDLQHTLVADEQVLRDPA
ncbi:PREDICTED: uncharacterized protein LOC106813868 [Priapulus caudatus]|uniref:Uncharacterized protein LOC106813868 n=1 Tax=Priapulus caudatus TaxID=37621 RepID=A0ABM1EN25_PRICU|nr:PREDICTED: uncharacterized protein LOC106813868 [Priapulus caudatus]